MNIRVGIGYDAHRFSQGRKLIIGGVEISHDKGLDGHSDADVLTHAIIDSLLGAAGLGDIGERFPNGDQRYKNISSLLLLKEVNDLILSQNFQICNIDSTIIAEIPKMAPYFESMKKNFSEILALDAGAIGIKATTEEGMGFTGKGEGISASAVCLLYKNSGITL